MVSRGAGFEPCARVLEARCSPRSTPLRNDEGRRRKDEEDVGFYAFSFRVVDRSGLETGSCHGKSRLMGQESGPAFDAGTVRSVKRLPLGANRPAAQAHARLFGSAVALPGIAALARGHAVGPGRRSTLRARLNVVDGDRLGPRLCAAVLADEVVALGDVAPAERYRRVRQPVVIAPVRSPREPAAATGPTGCNARRQSARARPSHSTKTAGNLPDRRPVPRRSRARPATGPRSSRAPAAIGGSKQESVAPARWTSSSPPSPGNGEGVRRELNPAP